MVFHYLSSTAVCTISKPSCTNIIQICKVMCSLAGRLHTFDSPSPDTFHWFLPLLGLSGNNTCPNLMYDFVEEAHYIKMPLQSNSIVFVGSRLAFRVDNVTYFVFPGPILLLVVNNCFSFPVPVLFENRSIFLFKERLRKENGVREIFP